MLTGWNISLATGVAQVDNEHKELYRQAALLNQAMSEGKGRQEINKIIDFIGDYVVSHFVHEEQTMEQYRCPAAEINKTEHNKFIAKFKELRSKYDASGASSTLVLDMANTINTWLNQHISQIDSQLAKCTKTTAAKPVLSGK